VQVAECQHQISRTVRRNLILMRIEFRHRNLIVDLGCRVEFPLDRRGLFGVAGRGVELAVRAQIGCENFGPVAAFRPDPDNRLAGAEAEKCDLLERMAGGIAGSERRRAVWAVDRLPQGGVDRLRGARLRSGAKERGDNCTCRDVRAGTRAEC
jgi:hypothetical protein